MYLIERSGSFYYKALFIIFVLFVTRNIYIAEQLICGANKNFKHCFFLMKTVIKSICHIILHQSCGWTIFRIRRQNC